MDVSRIIARARKASQKDGRLRFIFATAYDIKISLKRVEFQDCYWTNGSDVGYWRAYAASGETRNFALGQAQWVKS